MPNQPNTTDPSDLDKCPEGIKRIDEPQINREITKLYLEKLELMTEEERKTLIKTIQLINNPIFVYDPRHN